MAKGDSKWMQSLLIPLSRRNNFSNAQSALSEEELDKLLSDLCCYGKPVTSDASSEGQTGDARRLRSEVPERGESRISDQNIQSIHIYLRELDAKAGRKGRLMWCQRPRIYAILRAINKVHLIDDFIREGQNDFLLPWNERTLPECLFREEATQVREDFLRVQHFYLTVDAANIKSVEEGGGKHQNIAVGGDTFFTPTKSLGQGGFGGVDAVQSNLSLQSFARKRVARGRHNEYNRQRQESIIAELQHLQMLTQSKHRHLVTIVGSYTDPEYIAYLMLPVAERNLEQFLSLKMSPSNKAALRKFYGCLAGAVHHLHENQMRHRDLKPRNILISRNEVYISDFGSAISWDRQGSSGGNTHHINIPVTREYMAPEIARDEPRGKPSDMWSLGAVYLEMTTRLLGRPVSELKQRIKKAAKDTKTAPFYHDNLRAVTEWLKTLSSSEIEHDNEPISWTKHLMHRRPEDRPKSGELMKDIHESPSFSVFCCFKCHPDFQVESSARDSIFARAGRRDALSTNETMGMVAKLLERPSAGLSAQKAITINKWLSSSSTEKGMRFSSTEMAQSRWLEPDTDPRTVVLGEETDVSEDFVDALEEQSQSSTSSTQLGKVQKESGVDFSQAGRTCSTMMGGMYFETAPLWVDEDFSSLYPSILLAKDGYETRLSCREPATISTSKSCASYRNIRDSNLGFWEYDDESSEHELFEEFSDYSDLSSEEGQPERLQECQPRKPFVVDMGQFKAVVPKSAGERIFDEESDISGDDVVIPEQQQESVDDVSALGLKSTLPQTTAEASQEESVTESLDRDRTLLDVLSVTQQVDETFSETSTLRPKHEDLAAYTDPHEDPAKLSESQGPVQTKHVVESAREKTEGSHEQASKPLARQAANDVPAPKPDDTPKEAPKAKPSTQLPKSALRSKACGAGPKKAATFQTVVSEVAAEMNSSATKGVDVPKIEIHLADTAPAQLSKANVRSLSKDPRRPKKREPLQRVDAAKVISDMAAMASTAPSSRMTERTKSSYDTLLFNMVPGEVERQIIRVSKEGKSAALRYLLEQYRGPGPMKRKHRVALVRAIKGASQSHNKCVETMIQAGVSVNIPNSKTGKTPLHVALENPDFIGYLNLIHLLVDPDLGAADINRVDWNGDPPLVTVFSGSDSAPLEKHRLSALALLLRQERIDVNISLPGSRNTPLHLAVRRQDHTAVAMLLYKNANVNAKNSAGTTPLQVAANQFRGEMGPNHAEVLDLLLSHGARVDEPAGALRRTPLHWAVISGTAHAVEMLLRYKANVKLKDSDGLDAMALAVKHAGVVTTNGKRAKDDRLDDHVEIMQRLSETAQCQWPTGQAKCPLQIAIEDGDVSLLNKLLKHGLDLAGPYLEGSIRDYAMSLGTEEVKNVVS